MKLLNVIFKNFFLYLFIVFILQLTTINSAKFGLCHPEITTQNSLVIDEIDCYQKLCKIVESRQAKLILRLALGKDSQNLDKLYQFYCLAKEKCSHEFINSPFSIEKLIEIVILKSKNINNLSFWFYPQKNIFRLIVKNQNFKLLIVNNSILCDEK